MRNDWAGWKAERRKIAKMRGPPLLFENTRIWAKIGLLATFLVTASGIFSPLCAAIRYVDASVPIPGDGSSWETAFRTLRAAVEKATEGDTIVVAPGEYRDEGYLSIPRGVALSSMSPEDPATVRATVIHEASIGAVFSLKGFTIRAGGGITCQKSATAVMNNVICNGGPLGLRSSSPLISGNLIFHGSCDAGAGIRCVDSSPIIVNNIIVGNTADRYGGGILCSGSSSPFIANNTIVGNSAGLHGGGIYAGEGSSPVIRNCILWDNGDELFNCSATHSCVQDGDPGEGNIAFCPHFVDPTGGDYRLNSWSPCIDTGDPSSPFSLEPEPNGGRINMGAYGNTPQAASKSLDLGADGLPDDWETFHFGHADYSGMDDPDGDGILNMDEYSFGWSPTIPSAAPIHNLTAGRFYELIQPAIVAARHGDEISVAPGRYLTNVDFLGKALTLRSIDPYDPAIVASTLLDGGASGSVVSFSRGEGRDSVISGFTITGGTALRGAGICCVGSSPTVSGNIIRENLAPAVYGTAGAGLYSFAGSPVVLGNVVEGNRATDGGGMYFESSKPRISDNVVRANDGDADGGGICTRGCVSVTVERNLIAANSSALGGGLFLDASRALVASNLIVDNYALRGGGIYLRRNATIVNNTIVGNSSAAGGGIYRAHGSGIGPVVNCIIWGDGEQLYAIQASYSCIHGEGLGEGNIHLKPEFVNADFSDYRLRPNSPCINSGNTAAALDVAPSATADSFLISWSAGNDLDGNPRISGNAVDIGAYEYQEGPANLQFVVQYSSDLRLWNSVEVGPAWQWIDEAVGGVPATFYRVGVP